MRLGLLEGDGIGPEVTAAAVRVVDAAMAQAGGSAPTWEHLPVGLAALESHGSPIPSETVDALEGLDGWILGPHDNVSYPPDFRTTLNPSGFLRKHFELFANVRPARTIPGVAVPASVAGAQLDLVIVRENTQGFYADRSAHLGSGEWMPTADVAIAQGLFTRSAIERIAHVACETAAARSGRLTIVHKANVLAMTMGMFRDVCQEVAAQHGALEVDDFHVDAMAALLIRDPSRFDVIVTENLFGDILSDLTAEMAGSLGIAASINKGTDKAMAQAVHGSAPDIAGQGIANPLGMIGSAALLLRWLASHAGDDTSSRAADLIDVATDACIMSGETTVDLGGSCSTPEAADRLMARLGV